MSTALLVKGAKAPPGGPPKITAKVVEALAAAVRRGASVPRAATGAGISERTFYRWMAAGLAEVEAGDGETLAGKLWRQVSRARADLEDELLGVVRAGAQGWQSAAWMLERGAPDLWGRVYRRPDPEAAYRIEEDDPLARMMDAYDEMRAEARARADDEGERP
jgi:hypothetical protein